MIPRPVKAVVFDMDGLLLDTEVVYREVMAEAAAVMGEELPEAVFLKMVGLPGAASREVALDHFGPEFSFDGWMAHVSTLAHERLSAGAPLKAGVAELLDRLDEAGLPRAIATSSSHDGVERHLGPSGLVPRFHAVIAAGDYAHGKPHPDPFLTAARRLGVAPADCLALEDSHNGVRAAAAAGMMTVMVPDLLPATPEMRALTVAVVDSLHDVAALL
ncbi:MAG: HAD family phosphatase [Caulobacteraceae bacterium]